MVTVGPTCYSCIVYILCVYAVVILCVYAVIFHVVLVVILYVCLFVAQYGRTALAEYCDYKSINQSIVCLSSY